MTPQQQQAAFQWAAQQQAMAMLMQNQSFPFIQQPFVQPIQQPVPIVQPPLEPAKDSYSRRDSRDHVREDRRSEPYDKKRASDRSNRDSDRSDRGYDKRDYDKREFDKRESEKRDFDKREYERKEYERKEYERSQASKRVRRPDYERSHNKYDDYSSRSESSKRHDDSADRRDSREGYSDRRSSNDRRASETRNHNREASHNSDKSRSSNKNPNNFSQDKQKVFIILRQRTPTKRISQLDVQKMRDSHARNMITVGSVQTFYDKSFLADPWALYRNVLKGSKLEWNDLLSRNSIKSSLDVSQKYAAQFNKSADVAESQGSSLETSVNPPGQLVDQLLGSLNQNADFSFMDFLPHESIPHEIVEDVPVFDDDDDISSERDLESIVDADEEFLPISEQVAETEVPPIFEQLAETEVVPLIIDQLAETEVVSPLCEHIAETEVVPPIFDQLAEAEVHNIEEAEEIFEHEVLDQGFVFAVQDKIHVDVESEMQPTFVNEESISEQASGSTGEEDGAWEKLDAVFEEVLFEESREPSKHLIL